MVRIVVQLTEEQARSIKRLGADRGVSVSALIRQGADLVLQAQRAPDRVALWNQAIACIGASDSGCGDLAEQHDRYLAEALAQ